VTITFVTFLMIFITAMLSAPLLVFCAFELRRRRHLGQAMPVKGIVEPEVGVLPDI
jgi:hypothetical protein